MGKPLLTKKGVHQQAGVFGYMGKLPLKVGVYSIEDIVPTVLELMRLPIPKTLDGTSLIAGTESHETIVETRYIPGPLAWQLWRRCPVDPELPHSYLSQFSGHN